MPHDTRPARLRRASPWRIAGWSLAALLLLLPLVAMRFTDEVQWTAFDFAVFAALLGGVGGAFELAARRSRLTAYRAGAAVALVAAFLLVWVNGAVGIIGSEQDPANLLFAGVLGVGLAGTLLARGRAAGLVRAFVATAVAQALVAALALAAGWGREALLAAVLFVPLWLASAALFRRAARAQGGAGAGATS